jgi:cobalt/nickel transport system ATP-binding protein
MTVDCLEVRDLAVARAGRTVLDGLDLRLAPGERVGLVGDNGAGKTTLLRTLVGLERPSRGTVEAFGMPCLDERAFRAVRLRVGLLFQDPDDQVFCATVLEDVAFGPLNQGLNVAAAEARAQATLATLGLGALAGRITHHLSGGEKRLAALAGVLAMAPEVLLLDEPTNALDATNRERLIGILRSLPQAMIVATHDRDLLDRLATRTLRLHDGRLQPAPSAPVEPADERR